MNDDGREIFAYMQTFDQDDFLSHVHVHERLEFCIYDQLFIQRKRQTRLFNIIRSIDEIKVKTLTNTSHAMRKETFFH